MNFSVYARVHEGCGKAKEISHENGKKKGKENSMGKNSIRASLLIPLHFLSPHRHSEKADFQSMILRTEWAHWMGYYRPIYITVIDDGSKVYVMSSLCSTPSAWVRTKLMFRWCVGMETLLWKFHVNIYSPAQRRLNESIFAYFMDWKQSAKGHNAPHINRLQA